MNKRALILAVSVLLLFAAPAYAIEVTVPGSTTTHEVCTPEANDEYEECEVIEEWETEEVLSAPAPSPPVVQPAAQPAPTTVVVEREVVIVVRHPHHKPRKHHKPHRHRHHRR